MFSQCVFSPLCLIVFPVIELSTLCLVVLTSPSPCCRGRSSHCLTTWCNCRETNPGWSTHWTHCDIDPLNWLMQTPCNFRRQRLLRRQLISGLQRRTFLYNRTRCCPTNPPYPRHLAASALLVTDGLCTTTSTPSLGNLILHHAIRICDSQSWIYKISFGAFRTTRTGPRKVMSLRTQTTPAPW